MRRYGADSNSISRMPTNTASSRSDSRENRFGSSMRGSLCRSRHCNQSAGRQARIPVRANRNAGLPSARSMAGWQEKNAPRERGN